MATDNIARGLATHALSVAQAGGGKHPVESVNGKTGKVNLTAVDVGAEPAGSTAKFVINLTEDANTQTYTADKTWAQIKAAYEGSKVLSVHIGSSELPMMNGQIAESGDAGFTFGYTNIIPMGSTVSTRAIHYLHTVDGDMWEDMDVEGEYLPVSGGTMTGNLDMGGQNLINAQKVHVDGVAPLYIGSAIEASGTTGARLTGTTSGDAAFVKADTQADYIPVYVGTPTAPNHAVNLAYLAQEVKDDSATKNHVSVAKNAAITIGLTDGVYFVSACDTIHRGLSVVYMCGSTTTISGLSGMAGWEVTKGAVDNSLYINNKSDAAALEVYIVAIGAGSAY